MPGITDDLSRTTTSDDTARASRAAIGFVDLPNSGRSLPSDRDKAASKGVQEVAHGLAAGGVAAAGGLVGSFLGPAGTAVGAGIAGSVGEQTGLTDGLAGLIDSAGAALFGLLGLDWVTSGSTVDGGSWERRDHPDGSSDYTESDGGITVHDHDDGHGGFTETVDGNGYHSDYKSNSDGSSHFEASDASGGYHSIDKGSDGTYGTADSDGRGNSTVTSSDGRGNSTTFSTHTDATTGGVTTTETNVTTDPDTGNVTTTVTVTNPDGTTDTTTTTTDKDGNPVDPGGSGGGSTPDPEGGTDEGRRIGPGQLGRARPGHPSDVVIGAGSTGAGDDFREGPVRLGDAVRGMALGLNAPVTGDSGSGGGADSSAERVDQMRRKLSRISVAGQASGEDFINPRAKAALVSRIGAAIVAGRRVN